VDLGRADIESIVVDSERQHIGIANGRPRIGLEGREVGEGGGGGGEKNEENEMKDIQLRSKYHR